jgi:hypothetical protein
MHSIKGSCFCGAVQYEYEGHFGNITVCHCGDCRKAQGGVVTAVPVDACTLRWTRGGSVITEYESSPGKCRAFCSRCGTPLYSRRIDLPDVLRLRMSSIDTPTDAMPVARIFTADQPSWVQPDEHLPHYPRQELGRAPPAVDANKD